MTDIEDPSRARDAVAAEKAAQRSHDLANHVQVMSLEINAVKSGLAANTAITKEIGEQQKTTTESLQHMQVEIAKVDFGKLSDMVDAIDTMKGGVKVLGWLERPMKWVAAVAGAIAAVWALYHTWGAK